MYEDAVWFVDTKNESVQIVPFSQLINTEKQNICYEKTLFLNNKIIVPTDKCFLIINSDGTTKKINHIANISRYMKLKAKNEVIAYVQNKEDKFSFEKNYFVCLDLNTHKQLLSYPINSAMKDFVIFSHAHCVFALTKKALFAFDISRKKSNPLLWKTEVTKKGYLPDIDSLYLSHDKSNLYSFNTYHGSPWQHI